MQPVRVHRPAGADVRAINHIGNNNIFYPAINLMSRILNGCTTTGYN